MSGSKDILIEQLRERAEKAERFNAYLLGETVYAQMQNEEETGDKIAEEIVETLMETLIEPWLGLNKEQIERCRVIIPERLPRAILWMGQLNRRLAMEEEEKKKLAAERDEARAERDEFRRRIECTPPFPYEGGDFVPLDDEQLHALRMRWSTGPEQYQADADALIGTALHMRRERDERAEKIGKLVLEVWGTDPAQLRWSADHRARLGRIDSTTDDPQAVLLLRGVADILETTDG